MSDSYVSSMGSAFTETGYAPPCVSDLVLPIPGLRPDVQGIIVGVRDVANIPSEVQMIEQVLRAGDIQYRVNLLAPDFFADESFVLIIGAKSPL